MIARSVIRHAARMGALGWAGQYCCKVLLGDQRCEAICAGAESAGRRMHLLAPGCTALVLHQVNSACLQSIAERGFDPWTFGLCAQHANHCATLLIFRCLFKAVKELGRCGCGLLVCSRLDTRRLLVYLHCWHCATQRCPLLVLALQNSVLSNAASALCW